MIKAGASDGHPVPDIKWRSIGSTMEPTKISDFVRESYVVVDVESKDNLQLLKQQVCSIIAERFPEFKEGALSELHNFVPVEDINELRLEIFQTLNDSSGFLDNTSLLLRAPWRHYADQS